MDQICIRIFVERFIITLPWFSKSRVGSIEALAGETDAWIVRSYPNVDNGRYVHKSNLGAKE